MRLIYSLPKLGDTLSHDSPLLKIIRLAVAAFILISAVTVFWGVKAHISQYLSYYSPWIQYPAFSVGFLLFSLAPDALNAILVAYVARSILKRKFDHLSIILMVFCSLLSVGLTIYSYQMSKFSAVEAANEASGEAKTIDLSPIDAKHDAALQRIQDDYNSEKTTIESNYAGLIQSENDAIASWEKKRTDGNTQWIDRQQDKRRKAIATLLEKQKSDLEALRSRKQAKEDEAGAQHQKDRTKAESDNTANETRHESFAAIFADKLSWLSGNAVFVVLILTCIREILYNRNGVEIKPVFGQFDFQPSPILESLSLPFVAAGRYLINAVRAGYDALPELKQRPDFEAVVDYSNYTQKVNTPGGKNPQQAQGSPTPSAKQKAQPEKENFFINRCNICENYFEHHDPDLRVCPTCDDEAHQRAYQRFFGQDNDADSLFQDNGFSKNRFVLTEEENAHANQRIKEKFARIDEADNIFTNPQRITIRGFQPHKVQSSEPANGHRNNGHRNNGESGNGKTKSCKHCGNEFEYKHWNAQYCSDDCRIAAWEQRTGRTFVKPDAKKKKRKSNSKTKKT